MKILPLTLLSYVKTETAYKINVRIMTIFNLAAGMITTEDPSSGVYSALFNCRIFCKTSSSSWTTASQKRTARAPKQ